MDILFFFYNNLIMACYLICFTGFLILHFKRNSKTCLYVALMFLFFILDNLIPYMNEFLPGFDVRYEELITNDPYLTNFIGFAIVLCYRMALLSFQGMDMRAWERVFWVLLLIVYFTLSSLYPMAFARITMIIIRRAISIAVFAAAYAYSRKAPPDSVTSKPWVRSLLLAALLLQIAASIEYVLPYFGVELPLPDRIIFIEIIGLYFTALGCIYIIREFIKLITAKEGVSSGSQRTAGTLDDAFCDKYLLTPREREVIRLIFEGLSNEEIAQALVVTQGTAKTHVHNIYSKLGINNRFQLLNLVRDYSQDT